MTIAIPVLVLTIFKWIGILAVLGLCALGVMFIYLLIKW